MSPYRAIVFDSSSSLFLSARTLRALASRGLCREDLCGRAPQDIASHLADIASPVWFVRAGSWPSRDIPCAALPPSGTGHALCALGATLTAPGMAVDAESTAWKTALAATGGSFHPGGKGTVAFPPLDSFYLEPPVVAKLSARLQAGENFEPAVLAELSAPDRRVVRFAPLDVFRDPSLRVAQIVTSLQRGGAERIALDLHRAMDNGAGHSLLIALGRATRAAFPTPRLMVDVSRAPGDRPGRIAAALAAIRTFAPDVVHGHLLDAVDVRKIAAAGVPLVLTIHNMRPGWPVGLQSLAGGDATLLVACAYAVEDELRASLLPIPLRMVWNGVDFGPFTQTPAMREAAGDLRRRLGIAPDAFVLVALANPRPQKRMERLPAIIAATREEFDRRKINRAVVLLVAGEPSRANPTAAAAEAAIRAAIDEHRLNDHVHLLGAVEDVPVLLAASDALVCVSGYEGLSLAHVEALAADRPVVATAVGGTAELAWQNLAVRLLHVDATPQQFAAVLADIAEAPPASGRAVAEKQFSTRRMAAAYRRLYAAAIHAHHPASRPQGLWLVTNNFSTGGAQSSAARLLRGLAAEGIPVRAAVLQEEAGNPTPGRQRLQAAGIPVLALPAAGTVDTSDAVMQLRAAIAADAPRVVLLWNVIPEYKVLLADVLWDVPLFDVSPGEMYFASLERYFCNPRPGLAYRTPQEYGARLSGAIVKYQGEAALAAERLGVKVHVVPNGVPLHPNPTNHASRPLVAIGTAARISPQKKLEDLLTAVHMIAAELPPYELRIAGGPEQGSDDYARQLGEMAAGLNVRWLGDREDLGPFYRDLDLFAMISEPAGCPNASLEAMSAGLPVVCTDVGGAGEQVLDGRTGRIVPRGDAAALAAGILQYARDPQLRARHGAAARQRIAAHFDVARMVRDYRRILRLGKDE